jgi:rare lipoprotein A
VLRTRRAALAAALALAAGACGRKKRRPPPPAPQPRPARPPVAPAKPGTSETGVASWYGHPYHGRRAANGEVYDMEEMTAAHRTLPFDTWVRVENLTNHKTVDVRITDRGPFIEGRIIDLSRAAARAIDLIGPGIARVRIEVVRGPAVEPVGAFAVQVGAFRDKRNAERLRDQLAPLYGSARLIERPGNPTLWKVLVGTRSTEEQAVELMGLLRSHSPEISSAFVVRIDLP